MCEVEGQSTVSQREPPQHLFLKPWMPFSIGGLAAVMTVVFCFRESWYLAITVVVAGCSLATVSWVLRFYLRQVYLREALREKEFKGVIEAREATVRERESTIHQLEQEIRRQESALVHVRVGHKRAIEELWRFIQVCRQENEKMLNTYKHIAAKTAPAPNSIVSSGLAQNFLNTALDRMIHVFQALLPSRPLWAAVRQHKPGESTYVTQARSGSFSPARGACSEAIPEDRSIPKMLRDQFNKDGAGVIITDPKAPEYDQVQGDQLKENLSIMAAPILGGKSKVPGQIRVEMPMWIALNSPQPNAFPPASKPYMACCASVLSELVKGWPDIIKVVK